MYKQQQLKGYFAQNKNKTKNDKFYNYKHNKIYY